VHRIASPIGEGSQTKIFISCISHFTPRFRFHGTC
jgi:hypothetical protein